MSIVIKEATSNKGIFAKPNKVQVVLILSSNDSAHIFFSVSIACLLLDHNAFLGLIDRVGAREESKSKLGWRESQETVSDKQLLSIQ